MAAILARKLGMTQRFADDGRVERVTVLEAGPCPVTGIRTVERDGYEAVQLAFGPVKEKSITRAELGHLKKADASAMHTVREFRDEVGELLMGQTVTVEAFSPGDKIKVSGTSKGKGFQGTIKRHNFKRGPKSHGSHNVRAPLEVVPLDRALEALAFGLPGHLDAVAGRECVRGDGLADQQLSNLVAELDEMAVSRCVRLLQVPQLGLGQRLLLAAAEG